MNLVRDLGQYSLKNFHWKKILNSQSNSSSAELTSRAYHHQLNKIQTLSLHHLKKFQANVKKTERVFTITQIKLSAQSSKDSKSPNRQLCLVRSQPRVILIATLQLRWITDFEQHHNLPR